MQIPEEKSNLTLHGRWLTPPAITTTNCALSVLSAMTARTVFSCSAIIITGGLDSLPKGLFSCVSQSLESILILRRDQLGRSRILRSMEKTVGGAVSSLPHWHLARGVSCGVHVHGSSGVFQTAYEYSLGKVGTCTLNFERFVKKRIRYGTVASEQKRIDLKSLWATR